MGSCFYALTAYCCFICKGSGCLMYLLYLEKKLFVHSAHIIWLLHSMLVRATQHTLSLHLLVGGTRTHLCLSW
jgi:hypothetical protein